MEEEAIYSKVNALYEELRGLLYGLGEPSASDRIYNGPVTQYEHIVSSLSSLLQEDLNRFLPYIQNYNPQERTASTIDLKTSASGLVAWLGASYLKEKEPHYAPSHSPTNQVTVTQEVAVTQTLIVDITDILATKQNSFNPGSKERKFIDKVKSGLGAVKDVASILALIAKTASDCGLTTAELHKIFS